MLINALARLHTSNSFRECDSIIQHIHERNFYSSNRMNTPFIYCDETGKPYTYSGKVLSTKNTSGFIAVNKLPRYLGGNVGVRFKMYNLGITNATQEEYVLTMNKIIIINILIYLIFIILL